MKSKWKKKKKIPSKRLRQIYNKMAFYIKPLSIYEDKEEDKISLFIYKNIDVNINITSYFVVY